MNKSMFLLSIAAFVSFPAWASAQNYPLPHAHGHAVRVQQRINEHSPGVTRHIAPDAKQSATGGQPGGLPGHS